MSRFMMRSMVSNIRMRLRSLRRNTRGLDHLRPFVALGLQQAGKALRRPARRLHAERGETIPGVAGGEDLRQPGAERGDDIGRRAGGRYDAVPGAADDLSEAAFLEGRNIAQ